MQIEFVTDEDIILLHIEITKDRDPWIIDVAKKLKQETGKTVVIVPNGQPLPKNGPSFYVCRDSSIMMGIVEKLMQAKPGSIIPMTDKEMKALENPYDFKVLPFIGECK